MNIIKQFCDIGFSLFSVVVINFTILFIKISSKKNICFFYHPKKNLTKNHIDYIEVGKDFNLDYIICQI